MNNPFETHQVNSLAEVGPFAEWLSGTARAEQKVAIALRERQKKIAFSTRDDCWIVDLKSPAAPFVFGILRTQIIDHNQIKLVARDLYQDLVDLSKILAPLLGFTPNNVFQNLAPAFVGDLTSAAHVINQTVTPKNKMRLVEHDAYDVALLEEQYGIGIVPYYEKVGLPFAKLQAEAVVNPKRAPEWWVTYQYLWIRVLAYYTGDATLVWSFAEGRDPLESIQNVIHCESREQAEALLLWQACGRDIAVFRTRFAALIPLLPDSLPVWANIMDKALPSLSVACGQMQQAYQESRSVETLYKRKLRPGNPAGEAVAFRVFGTVEDLLNVAAVTFWNNRPTTDVLISYFDGTIGTTRIGGVGPQRGVEAWTQQLKPLSTLANPLGPSLELHPIVTQAPR